MLRRILVITLFEPEIPIPKNSALDIALLRAAHQTLLRQQQGITDVFLFVLCGELTSEEATLSLAPYGFPEVSVLCIRTKDEEGDVIECDDEVEYDDEIDAGDVRVDVGDAISPWLNSHHPAAVTCLFTDGYESLDLWWSGVEAEEDEWSFASEYAKTLPGAHRKTAITWLAILKEALELDDPTGWVDENRFALYAATLCEWLHGFNAASGDGYNHFAAESVCDALHIDDLFLGFLMGQYSSGESLEEIFYNAETDDPDGIKFYALRQATEGERMAVRRGLSKFFGGDTALFWALHTAIWPNLNKPSVDACNDLVNPSSWDDMGEVMGAWEFVTTGWTDSADE